jgi:thiamine-phosphate diphosphorylase/hydroxyethylthiazole kinase
MLLTIDAVIAMTGKVDYVSDGYRTFAIENGHEYLGKITGSGCMATTAIACFLAVIPEDPLMAAVAGLVVMGIAGEQAVNREEVRGPGSFRAALIDELYNLTPERITEMIRIKGIH